MDAFGIAVRTNGTAYNDTVLTAAGWLVLRFWEHEDPLVAAERIAEAVIARREPAGPRLHTSKSALDACESST
jgi:hypothetical protein